MSIVAPPVIWDADARSRAQTRGLLMALSRDRQGIFRFSTTSQFVLCVLTLGVFPPLLHMRRFRRLRRAEWSQYIECSAWIEQFAFGHGDTALSDSARRERRRLPSVTMSLLFGVILVAMIVFVAVRQEAGTASHWIRAWPLSAGEWWRLSLIVLSAVAIERMSMVLLQRIQFQRWLKRMNAALLRQDRRPLRWRSCSPLAFMAALLISFLLIGQSHFDLPLSIAMSAGVVLFQKMSLDSARRIHLQLIERLLEWMDDSGVPVEYDVVALKPDEIAAMIG